jgi:chromosome condensin MukBEF MukE localization factor
MKKALIATIVLLTTIAHAKTVQSDLKPTAKTIAASDIEQVIRLVDKKEDGSSHKKLQIVVTDAGMSTDVSPRYTVRLGYASLAEMGNISADFKISDQAFQFVSATRKAPGIYEVKTIEYRDEDGMVDVTHTINATKMFVDEREARKACGDDFCDKELKTSIEVTETAVKQSNN